MDRDFIVPWALTIADALENGHAWERREVAAELRRLHAENKRLETLCYDYLGELTALRAAEQMRKQTFMAEYKFRTYGYYQDADGKMQVGEIPEEMLTVSAERTAQMMEEVTRTEQEPVAWIYRGNLHPFDPSDWATEPVTPLYTQPPQRKPLTDEEIELLAVKHAPPIDPEFAKDDDFIEFARAIERAHGIGGEA
jgi:hypothetical protein